MGISSDYQAALASTNLIHWSSWIPLMILVLCTLFEIPAFISIATSCLVASFFAIFMVGIAPSDTWTTCIAGYTATTYFDNVDILLTKVGMVSMLFTISLVLLALGFGGLLFTTGIIPTILSAFQDKLTSVRSTILSTAMTAIGINVMIGEQYLSILLTGETFKGVYEKAGLSKK